MGVLQVGVFGVPGFVFVVDCVGFAELDLAVGPGVGFADPELRDCLAPVLVSVGVVHDLE